MSEGCYGSMSSSDRAGFDDVVVIVSCIQEHDDAEVAALADEADMPLEQLLAMYGMVVDEDNAPAPGSKADGGAQKPTEGRRSRSSKRRKMDSGIYSPF